MAIPQSLGRVRSAALGVTLIGCALAGCAGHTAPASAPVATAAATPAATPDPPASPGVVNDDVVAGAPTGATSAAAAEAPREWLQDADGKRFYLDTYPKSYAHLRLADNRVRTVWGIVIHVEREDDKNFFYRIYEGQPDAKGPSLLPAVPTEEIKASYVLDVPRVDRIGFAPFDRGLPRSGQWRQGAVVADIDGDGQMDIVHGPPRKSAGGPAIFLGDGRGGWRRWSITWPSFPYDYGDVAVGDLDGDSRLDLVLAAHLHGVVALLQTEPGKFELGNRGLHYRLGHQEPLGFSSRAVTLVDWNGDRRLDIAALSEGPVLQVDRRAPQRSENADAGLLVYLNEGGGNWRETSPAGDTIRGLFGDHLVDADVDRDGRRDLVASSNVYGRKDLVFRNDKKGVEVETVAQLRPAYTRAVAAADFDGDRASEVAVGFLSSELAPEWRTGIDILDRRPNASWERSLVWVESGNHGLWSLTAGDLDGDDRTDLVALTGDGRVIVLLGDGKGGFAQQEAALTETAAGCRGYGVTLADLDRDGRDEIVAAFAGESSGVPGLLEEPGCPGGGSLRVWKITPRAAG
jgi:hypothetical protein